MPPLNPDEVYRASLLQEQNRRISHFMRRIDDKARLQAEQLAFLAKIPASDLTPTPQPAWPFRLSEEDRTFLRDCFIDPA